MDMDLQVSLAGRHALVTGASKGLGAHFAKTLAAAGVIVAVAARKREDCERVCADIRGAGGTAFPITIDVASGDSVATAIEQATKDLGGIDILVNNAGVADTVPLIDQDEAGWDRTLDTNLKGAFLVGQAVARVMRSAKSGGTIINIASILGHRVAGQVAAYAASKAALVQLTKCMALEWARYGIRVNALCPGYIETGLNRDFFESEAGKAVVKRIPQRRLGQLADLEGPLLFMCSNSSRYVTGSSLIVDGGHLVSSL
jgi:NAD(P)-dependent dehydrogenase (short-subunit alcohol dehydrogenase family)